MMDIADFLHRTLEAREDAAALAKIREEVRPLSNKPFAPIFSRYNFV